MKLQESAENYLENLLILKQRLGEVRSVDVANEMGFSKPSVSRAVHLLEDNGYLDITDAGFLELTEKGLTVAKKIYERHLFLTDYLLALGVDEETAAEDACRIEHVISDSSISKMKAHINYCSTVCPNRNDERFFKFNSIQIRKGK